MPTHLFVYGTLMRGESRHRHLDDQVYVGEAQTQSGYRMFNAGDFPALVIASPGREITGELWLVDADLLHVLDEVEGVAEGLYARRPVQLQPQFDKLAAETYIYLQSVTGLPEIDGNWRTRGTQPVATNPLPSEADAHRPT